MFARSKTAALLALLPAAAIAASAIAAPAPPAKPKPRKPVKKPSEPPAPTPTDTQPDKAPDPAPAPTAPAGPAGGGGGGNNAGGTAGGGGGDEPAEPAPAKPAAKPAKPDESADVDSLRQEYLSLRDELFKSRARANAVASQLYSTRIQVKLTYTTARFYNPAKASIRLDGASIYEDASGAIAGDDGVRFDGFVAPGRHLITFRVEATGKDDDTFGSTTESQVVVKAVAGKDLVVAAKAHDAGDIAYEWKRSEQGSYGLGIDVAVKTAKTVEAAPAPGDKSQPKADKK